MSASEATEGQREVDDAILSDGGEDSRIPSASVRFSFVFSQVAPIAQASGRIPRRRVWGRNGWTRRLAVAHNGRVPQQGQDVLPAARKPILTQTPTAGA